MTDRVVDNAVQVGQCDYAEVTGDGANPMTAVIGNVQELWIIRKLNVQNVDDTNTPDFFCFTKDDVSNDEVLQAAAVTTNTTSTVTRLQQRVIGGSERPIVIGNGILLRCTWGVPASTLIANTKKRRVYYEYEVIKNA